MKVINEIDLLIASELSKDLTRKWSIHELSVILNKHYKPVYEAVQRLINESYVTKNSNGLIEPLFKDTLLLELAEKLRLESQNKEIMIIASRLGKINSSYFSCVLFGSSVKKKGRDFDILLIVPNSETTEKFRLQAESSLGSFYGKIDLNIINERSSYEMLNHPNQLNVMNEIMKNHLVLLGTEGFYRVIRRWKNG